MDVVKSSGQGSTRFGVILQDPTGRKAWICSRKEDCERLENPGSCGIFKTVTSPAMGPTLATSIAVRTGIETGSRPWTARSVRVPFAQLCRSMQSMHNRGLAIDSVALSYCSGEAGAPAPAAAPVAAVAEEAPKASAKKPAKRGWRRKRG